VRAWRPSRRFRQWHERPGVPPNCPGARGERQDLSLSFPFGSPQQGRSLVRFTSDPRLEAEASRRFSRIPAWSRSSVAVHLGSALAEAAAVSRWVPIQAEACPVVPWVAALTEISAAFRGLLLRPKSPQLPVDPFTNRSPFRSPEERRLGRSRRISPFGFPSRPKPVQVSWSAVRTEVLAALPDPGLGRSPCRSPFGSPLLAEALAVHLSGKSVPAGAGRSFPAGKRVDRSRQSSRLDPRSGRSPGGSPPEARVGRSRSVLPVWILIKAEALAILLRRFREAEASGSTWAAPRSLPSVQKHGASP
jgi:hypothetical protein